MHGPYTVKIIAGRDESIVVVADDLREVQRRVEGFYQDASPALAAGALRCGVFYAAALLAPGEDAEVEVAGYEGSGRREREAVWHRASVRREPDGRLFSSLGSRFGERHFVGV